MSSTESATKLELKAARSDFLDAFAEVEGSIQLLEEKFALRANNASLGQKLGRLQKLSAVATAQSLQATLATLAEFNVLRTELVHRAMNCVAHQGTTKALFIARDHASGMPPTARVLTLAQFKALASQVKTLSKQLSDFAEN